MPAGRRAGLLVGLSAALALACRPATAPEDRLALRFRSEHFDYYTAPGDTVDSAWQEAYYAWVTSVLVITSTEALEYRKYRDDTHARRVTGRTCCFAEDPPSRAFHTSASRDNHEMVHVLVGNVWGRAPGLINEGLIVAHHGNPLPAAFAPGDPYWAGRPVHDVARERAVAGTVPPLDALLASEDFFAYPSDAVYPLAGSFVRYLVDSGGLAPLRAYVADSRPGDAPAKTRQLFAAAFGTSLDDWWAGWLVFLEP